MTRDSEPYPPPLYAWYVVGVLLVIYVFSFIDRQILSLLVDPIRRDLDISDTQMSLLMGFSFALFYTFFGIPMGRLADTRSRRAVIAAGLVVWSAMTAACGIARQYWHFLLLRMGVGVGEAALSPSAYSLITDYFPRRKLGVAIGVYTMGTSIGSGIAFLLGGVVVGLAGDDMTWQLPLIGAIRPWQVVFFAVGLPGILLSLLLLSVREPIRRGVRRIRAAADGVEQVPISEVIAYLRANWRTLTCHNLAFAFLAFSSYGAGAWIPTYLQRVHGMAARDSGIWFGLIVMFMGATGHIFGGRLADRLRARGYSDASMRTGLISAVIWLPTGILYPIAPSAFWALAFLTPTVFISSWTGAVAPAAIQEMMPNPMRGQASALYLFVVNLIGLGLGPTAVAMCTDYVFRDDVAVGYSLLWVSVLAHVGSVIFLWLGLKQFRHSLERLDKWTNEQEV